MKLKKLNITLLLDNKDKTLALILVNKIDNFIEELMNKESIDINNCDYIIKCS